MAEAIRRFAADTHQLEKVYRNGISPLEVLPVWPDADLDALAAQVTTSGLRKSAFRTYGGCFWTRKS